MLPSVQSLMTQKSKQRGSSLDFSEQQINKQSRQDRLYSFISPKAARNQSPSSIQKLNNDFQSSFLTNAQSSKYVTQNSSYSFGKKKFQANKLKTNTESPRNTKTQLVGTSAYSSVFKVEIPDIQKVFSLKVKKISSIQREREQLILRQCFFGQSSHPNFIQLQHYFTTKSDDVFYYHYISEGSKFINLVTDYVPMNLRQFIQSHKTKGKAIPKIIIKLFVFQLFRAVAFMHEHKIMHRDLHPDNILVNIETLQIKICDFGSAKFTQQREMSNLEVGNRHYRAPELLLGVKNYNSSIDLWALGCIFVELVTLEPLFQGNTKEEIFSEIIKQLGTPSPADLMQLGSQILDLKLPTIITPSWSSKLKQADHGIIDIISLLIQYQPKKRGEAFDFMRHIYFKELKKPSIKINGRDLPKIFDFTQDELKFERYQKSIHSILPDWYQDSQSVEFVPTDLEKLLKFKFS